MKSALDSAIGLPSSPTSALEMLGLLMPEEVRRNFTTDRSSLGERVAGAHEPLPRLAQQLVRLAEREPDEGAPELGPREEGRARHRRHTDLRDEPPGERHVVLGAEARDVAEDVVRAVRSLRLEARAVERGEERVPARAVMRR